MIHAERCKTKEDFLQRAQRWQDTWNFFRPHSGKGMNGRTPFEKFIDSKSLVSSHVFQFPTLLLEDILKKVGTFYSLFCNKLGGKYVFTKCHAEEAFKIRQGQKKELLREERDNSVYTSLEDLYKKYIRSKNDEET